MTSGATTPMDASPLAPLVDETRLGSVGGQAAIGVAGIVLAIILVVGQISLATTKGIALHLHAAVVHTTKGNEVMESVIERAAPSVQLETVLAEQSKTLANTSTAMAATNAELDDIASTTDTLSGVVATMETTSAKMAADVASIDESSTQMTELLGELPAATKRTHAQLARINADTAAINGELDTIAAKMLRYGLPRALGAPTG